MGVCVSMGACALDLESAGNWAHVCSCHRDNLSSPVSPVTSPAAPRILRDAWEGRALGSQISSPFHSVMRKSRSRAEAEGGGCWKFAQCHSVRGWQSWTRKPGTTPAPQQSRCPPVVVVPETVGSKARQMLRDSWDFSERLTPDRLPAWCVRMWRRQRAGRIEEGLRCLILPVFITALVVGNSCHHKTVAPNPQASLVHTPIPPSGLSLGPCLPQPSHSRQLNWGSPCQG